MTRHKSEKAAETDAKVKAAIEGLAKGLYLTPYSAAKELQLATQGTDPDATDLYVLGVTFQNLKQNSDAAAAFQKCSAIPGGLQDRCKQSAQSAK